MGRQFFDHRQDYSLSELREDHLPEHPMRLLEQWSNDAVEMNHPEPLAFALSTTSPAGQPSSRIVLLKEITDGGLVFFTNYLSRKGEEIAKNPFVAAHFFWPLLQRQIRIEGKAEKTSEALSDQYFNQRPLESRIAAIISPQSKIVPSRRWLEEAFENAKETNKTIKRPKHWGGYEIKPHQIEFWQGRPNRLHDRLVYTLINETWHIYRLAP